MSTKIFVWCEHPIDRFLLIKVHRNKKVHRMTAATRKQGACFPGELWEQIKRTADSQKTTPSKVIVQAVREMMDRKTKRGEKK
jgi:hypothetical protein